MKKKKIITSILLVLAMVLSMGIPALADGETGSITIEQPVKNQKYKLYRIFDLEGYDTNTGAYSYVVNTKWHDFANDSSVAGKFITLSGTDAKSYVTWIEAANVEAFARLAIEWAKDKGIEAEKEETAASAESITVSGLPLGYYLIDSSVGALCALNTTNPDAIVREKNEQTTIEKKVQENSTNDFGAENSAKIGETVTFKSEITLGAGTEKLVAHDKMDKGLSFNASSIEVYVGTELVAADNYTVKTDVDDCTFEISFADKYIAGLTKGTVLLVKYTAVLNSDARLAGESNNNETWVTFGDTMESTHSTTKTYTYRFDLIKTDENGKVIAGARFLLYDAKENGNVIPLVAVKEDETNGVYEYRVANAADGVSGNGAEIKSGYAKITGLDRNVYYLEETKQPTGFNKLSARVQVDLTGGNIDSTMNELFTAADSLAIGKNAGGHQGVQIVNKAGTQLPSTGGMGTTLFYLFGGILVAAAGVFLVTRKRMSKAGL